MWLGIGVMIFWGWISWFQAGVSGFAPSGGKYIPTLESVGLGGSPTSVLVTSSARSQMFATAGATHTPIFVTSSVRSELFVTAGATHTPLATATASPSVTPSATITNTLLPTITPSPTDKWAICIYPNVCQSCVEDNSKFCPMPTVIVSP